MKIVIKLDNFPFYQHQNWLKEFISCFESSTVINITESEYTGETSGCCLTFEETVFILNISELVESVWIEPTKSSLDQVKRLHQVLLNQFNTK